MGIQSFLQRKTSKRNDITMQVVVGL